MQKDSESSPITDENFYFQNWANYTPEHATIDLLYPTPGYITRWKNKKQLTGSYLVDNEGHLLVGNNHLIVGTEAK